MNKRGFAIFSLIVFLLLAVACGKPPAGPAPAVEKAAVQVEVLSGVGSEAADEVRRAAEATTGYFAQAFGLRLRSEVTIVLTPDRKTYLAEVANRFKIDELAAQRASQGTDALSGGRLIVVNIAGIPTARQQTFLVAHELTHHYQQQIAGSGAGKVKWLLEGMADVVGAQVVARRGYWDIQQYRNNWRAGLLASAAKPALAELETAAGWSAAISRYGSPTTYRTAGFAVLVLSDRYGQGKILDYFAGLGRGEAPEAAFQKAFGIPLSDYETEFGQSMRKVS